MRISAKYAASRHRIVYNCFYLNCLRREDKKAGVTGIGSSKGCKIINTYNGKVEEI